MNECLMFFATIGFGGFGHDGGGRVASLVVGGLGRDDASGGTGRESEGCA